MKKMLFAVFAMMLCVLVSCTTNTTNKEEKSNSLYRILVADKYGFIDEHGKIVIEPQFDDAYTLFSEGVCFARIGERRGLIDNTGTFIMEFGDSVRMVSNFIKGLSRINCGYGKVGVINRDGKVIVPTCQYDARVRVDGDSVYINVEGLRDYREWFIASRTGDTIGDAYDTIWYGFDNERCAVRINDKWGYIDRSGKFVIDTIYDYVRTFTDDGIARVRKGSGSFFIDKSGNRLFAMDSIITGFGCNRAAGMLNGEKCLVDRTGRKICSIDADKIYPFRDDNMATIIRNGKALVIDTLGNVVLSTNYENIGTFIGGVAPVQKNEKWGFIDTTGKEIVSATNDEYIYAFHKKDSKLRAVQSQINGVWVLSYYDLKGNLIWKDLPNGKKELLWRPERKDFIEYFDARIAELDPIEGVYYVTNKDYYQDRDNPNIIGLNNSNSEFYAILRNENTNDFKVMCVDKPGYLWKNKFVNIGESNIYAIMSNSDDEDKYSSEGRITLEDPTQFEFRLEQGHNVWNNFFVTYEFIRDYPPISEYEKVQKAEWSGTGFAIADGFIATNYHVTSGAKTIRIKGINGDMSESYKGFMVASDKEHDISIIKVVDKDFEGFGTIPYNIGKVTVDVGDDVFVLGYPMTATMGEEIKLTDGKISAASGYKGDESMYQISAAVQPGNSGGPVFNSDGTIIGIVCAKHADAENANYAIKVSYLYSLVAASNLGFDIAGKNQIHGHKLNKMVKEIKNYVYIIECSSK